MIRCVLTSPIDFRIAVVLVAICSLCIIVGARWRGISALPPGPSEDMAQVTRDIAERGTIDGARYQRIHSLLQRLSRDDGGCYWQDLFSLDNNNVLHPMHGEILSMLTVPLYVVLGDLSFSVLPFALLVLLFTSLFSFVLVVTKARALIVLDLFVAILSTPFLLHGVSFGYDLLGATLVATALVFLVRKPVIGGILLASTILIRPTNALLLPLLLFTLLGKDRTAKEALILAGSGALLTIILSLMYNYSYWGSPLITVNHRMPRYCSGEVQFYSPALSLSTLLKDWWRKLFDPDVGFLLYSNVALLFPWAVYRLRHSRFALYGWLVAAVAAINFLVIFSFHCWDCTMNGNRFLLPISLVMLAFTLLAIPREVPTGE